MTYYLMIASTDCFVTLFFIPISCICCLETASFGLSSLDNASLDQVEVELTNVTLSEAGEEETKFILTFLAAYSLFLKP